MSKRAFEVPEAIDDLDLNVYEFRLYGHLKRQLDNGEGPEGVRELAERCRMSVESVSNSFQSLLAHGLIEVSVLSPEEAKAFLRKKYPQSLGNPRFGWRTCQWCGATTLAIHRHHYPIQKSEGGTETVSICASCHAEYHMLTNGVVRALYLGEEDHE